MARLEDVLALAVEALRPPPVETLPQFIERVVRLQEGTIEPGPVRLWPPRREIATIIGDPEVERANVVATNSPKGTDKISKMIINPARPSYFLSILSGVRIATGQVGHPPQ